MDNRIPNHPNSPDDDCNNPGEPYAVDVADNMMTNVISDYDYTTFKSVSIDDQADAFGEVRAAIAGWEYESGLTDYENLVEFRSVVEHAMRDILIAWAKREGFN